MILWLFRNFGSLLDEIASRTSGDSRVFVTARIAAAGLTGFVLTVLFGPMAIRWLRKRFRERIASKSDTLNKLHAGKSDTPTMGGLFVMSAVVFSSLIWCDLNCSFVLLGLAIVVTLTALGGWDDWVKQRTERIGISARRKFAWQLLIGALAGVVLRQQLNELPERASVVWPLGNVMIPLGWLFVAWCALVVSATANGVNLTDGLDGLAAGCTLTTASAYAALCYMAGNRVIAEYFGIPYVPMAGEVAIMLAALAGAMLGFLWFNCYPAQLFMGDAGSLPVGGLLAVGALVSRQELLLVVIGGVFVVETLSVIVQISSFRLTGRRLIRCSPLHNHFVFRGDHEMKIVIRFWIVSALLAVIGIASLKLS